jgi:hypothetical protein
VTRTATYAVYAAIFVAVVAAEVVARRSQRMTFADLVRRICRNRAGQVAVLAGWLWIGWHLFVRAQH